MGDKRTWECVKKPFQVIVTEDPAPNNNFWFGFRFIPSSPYSPQLCVAKCCGQKALISNHFAQNSTLFGVRGEGRLVLVISPVRFQHF